MAQIEKLNEKEASSKWAKLSTDEKLSFTKRSQETGSALDWFKV